MFQFRSIRTKLHVFSLMALLLVLTSAGAGWWSIHHLAGATKNVTVIGSALKSQQEADMMHDAIRGDVLAALLAVAKSDPNMAVNAKKDEAAHVAQFRAALEALKLLPLEPVLAGAVADVGPALKAYEESAAHLMKFAVAGQEPGKDDLAAFQEIFGQVEDAMGKLSNLIEDRGAVYLSTAESLNTVSRYLIAGASLIATILLFVVSALLARGIVRPIEEALKVADAIAAGDLTSRIDVLSMDEMGKLLQALAKMRDSLLHTVMQVRSATGGINTASSEIASGNQDLSVRTEQAASNLQRTAASMEELNSTVRQSADAARQANQLAVSASEVAVRGGQVVGQVVSTMKDIHHSSQKISDIIGVIDGIAFQTNILALNAAVEAARAGEQGRGFAVVAAEVRSLAQRSAEAAKEIKGLIGTSVDKVEAGSRLVAEAGQTMSEIVGSIQRVSDIVGEITAAASEQSGGIGQVNVAVNQLDQMTQQNAALVEESAAAAESLKDQAARLTQVVATFRLEGQAAVARPAPATVALAPTSMALPVTRLPKPAAKAANGVRDAQGAAQPHPSTPGPAPLRAVPGKSATGDDGDWESF